MKKLITYVLLSVLFLCLCLPLSGCDRNTVLERDYRFNPLTKEEVVEWTNKTFFDENGNAYKEYWENSRINFSQHKFWKYAGEDITGFEVQRIKGFDGRENYFFVEFEPTGYYFVCAEDRPNKASFKPFPSPFKTYNVPVEKRYAFRNGYEEPKCGMEYKPGYVIPFIPDVGMYDTGYRLPAFRGVYDSANKTWVDLHIIFNPETGTWQEEIEGTPFYRDYEKEPLTEEDVRNWTQEHFFDKDGNAYAYHWEDAEENRMGKHIWEYYDGITGFDVQEMKGFDGGKCYMVNFHPIGYFFVRADRPMTAYNFRPNENPFDMYNIPAERRYVLLDPEYASTSLYLGIDWKQDYLVKFEDPIGFAKDELPYPPLKTTMVYNVTKQQWEGNMKPDYLDPETLTWQEK